MKQGLGAGATPQCAATAAASQEIPPAKNNTDDGRGEGRWRMTFTPPRRMEVEVPRARRGRGGGGGLLFEDGVGGQRTWVEEEPVGADAPHDDGVLRRVVARRR